MPKKMLSIRRKTGIVKQENLSIHFEPVLVPDTSENVNISSSVVESDENENNSVSEETLENLITKLNKNESDKEEIEETFDDEIAKKVKVLIRNILSHVTSVTFSFF